MFDVSNNAINRIKEISLKEKQKTWHPSYILKKNMSERLKEVSRDK